MMQYAVSVDTFYIKEVTHGRLYELRKDGEREKRRNGYRWRCWEWYDQTILLGNKSHWYILRFGSVIKAVDIQYWTKNLLPRILMKLQWLRHIKVIIFLDWYCQSSLIGSKGLITN